MTGPLDDDAAPADEARRDIDKEQEEALQPAADPAFEPDTADRSVDDVDGSSAVPP